MPDTLTPKQVRVLEHKHVRRKNTITCDGCDLAWPCDAAKLLATIEAKRVHIDALTAAVEELREGAADGRATAFDEVLAILGDAR